MEVRKFDEILKNNNALFLDDEWMIFNDYELYNDKEDITIENKTLEELLERHINDKSVRELIEEKEEFTYRVDGGRGSSSGKTSEGMMGPSHAPHRGRQTREVLYPAELNIKEAKGNSVDSVLKRFQDKYGNANREYAIAVDEQGYAHQHIKGGKHSVSIQGGKGEIVIHNHPSGSNFSDTDLKNTASDNTKGVIATSSNGTTKGTYTFIKNKDFKSKEFIKALSKAQWDAKLGYNKGFDKWLRKNQKTYGYKYTAKGVKNADW